ncbi:MAG: cytochrome c3 family protein [Hyphomicrobiales bacterium]|nr:cytochrome c3 family protein [Hyphomicrobiales bacterium]
MFWLFLAICTLTIFIGAMVYGGPLRSQFLIGETTSGHYQIELACNSCHDPFGGESAMQDACESCHSQELKLANDSHPAKKFSDPRNADRRAILDATLCVTCHREHNPEITGLMGVTLPDDYCFLCHQDVGENRISHNGLPFDGCTAAGCHNFHDNRALYEDFLEKHADEPPLKIPTVITVQKPLPAEDQRKTPPLTLTSADAPQDRLEDANLIDDWHDTAHAKAGVNCKGCHAPKSVLGEEAPWADKPEAGVCVSCHKAEAETFTAGKHGMRLRKGLLASHEGLGGFFDDEALSPMRPALARLPMQPEAPDKDLSCTSCHGAHRFDVVKAQVDTCLSCHADEHSRAYPGSPHHQAWLAEQRGEGVSGSGVSCATCHMPRIEVEDEYGLKSIVVTHNQNFTLEPNEKMIRPVCLSCHGLQFSLDSLADQGVISSNFTKGPSIRVESIDWVMNRIKARQEK